MKIRKTHSFVILILMEAFSVSAIAQNQVRDATKFSASCDWQKSQKILNRADTNTAYHYFSKKFGESLLEYPTQSLPEEYIVFYKIKDDLDSVFWIMFDSDSKHFQYWSFQKVAKTDCGLSAAEFETEFKHYTDCRVYQYAPGYYNNDTILVLSFKYDSQGRAIAKLIGDPNGKGQFLVGPNHVDAGRRMTYVYDKKGNLIEERTAWAFNNQIRSLYLYDENQLLCRKILQRRDVNYDDDNSHSKIRRSWFKKETLPYEDDWEWKTFGSTEVYMYDSNLQLTEMQEYYFYPDQIYSRKKYSYDSAGRILQTEVIGPYDNHVKEAWIYSDWGYSITSDHGLYHGAPNIYTKYYLQDVSGNTIKSWFESPHCTISEIKIFEYNKKGQLIREEMRDGASNELIFVRSYVYSN